MANLWKVCKGPRETSGYEVIQGRLTLEEAKELRDAEKRKARPEHRVWIAIDPIKDESRVL